MAHAEVKISENQFQDPQVPDWGNLELSEAWPDSLDLKTFSGFFRFIKGIMGKRKPVELPEGIPERFPVPKYILQEFHNVPNGNYSQRFSRGYITGFDISMLGEVERARNWIAEKLKDCESVIDVGTAGGKTAAEIYNHGVKDVWGIDPSPYLLKHASKDYPKINFIHGIAEELPFQADRFDGISACFLFHEVPPRYIESALESFNKVLKPNGLVAISEPSEQQLAPFKAKEFLSSKGWLKIYFRTLANFVHEPFLQAWHKQDKSELFEKAGFELVEYHNAMPINFYLLKKV